MTNKPVDLGKHCGMAAQKDTYLRRLLSEVEANACDLRLRQEELQTQLAAAPAATWVKATEKARYLLSLDGASVAPEDNAAVWHGQLHGRCSDYRT